MIESGGSDLSRHMWRADSMSIRTGQHQKVTSSVLLKSKMRPSKMAQRIKALATQLDNLGPVPGTHRVERQS